MSRHGDKRTRERCGVPKKAVERTQEIALQYGLKHEETSGRLRKYIDWLFTRDKGWSMIRLFAEKVWIFGQDNLITVFPVPIEHRRAVNKLLRRKNEEILHGASS